MLSWLWLKDNDYAVQNGQQLAIENTKLSEERKKKQQQQRKTLMLTILDYNFLLSSGMLTSNIIFFCLVNNSYLYRIVRW